MDSPALQAASIAEGGSLERWECVLVAKVRWRISASAWKLSDSEGCVQLGSAF